MSQRNSSASTGKASHDSLEGLLDRIRDTDGDGHLSLIHI